MELEVGLRRRPYLLVIIIIIIVAKQIESIVCNIGHCVYFFLQDLTPKFQN